MNKTKSRTSLVLMELIITVLFFSIASAVCVQLFVNAHLTSVATVELNNAINIAENFSEIMRGTNGSFKAVSEMAHGSVIADDDNYFVVFYDKDFNTTDDYESAYYVADVTITQNAMLSTMNTKIVRLSDYYEIYSLESTTYIRKGDE